MTKQATPIDGVFVLQPEIFTDQRGSLWEHYNQQTLVNLGIGDHFIQDTLSISKQGVLRGLHYQKPPHTQIKLVSVLAGKVFDVAVDYRPQSQTYKKWFGIELSSENHTQLYIPAGCLHGFYVLSESACFMYKIAGGYYDKTSASGIRWDDPTLKIEWPLVGAPILSAQDQNLPLFTQQ